MGQVTLRVVFCFDVFRDMTCALIKDLFRSDPFEIQTGHVFLRVEVFEESMSQKNHNDPDPLGFVVWRGWLQQVKQWMAGLSS